MAIKCPFCTNKTINVTKKHIIEHLIVTKDEDDHFHVHGPTKDQALIRDFILNICKESGIEVEIEG